MKKAMMTVVGVLALAASANAQGKWYTDASEFYLNINFQYFTSTSYDKDIAAANSITHDYVTATATGSGTVQSFNLPLGYLQASADTPVTFTTTLFYPMLSSELFKLHHLVQSTSTSKAR